MFQEFLAIPVCVPANHRRLYPKKLKVSINNLRFLRLCREFVNLPLHHRAAIITNNWWPYLGGIWFPECEKKNRISVANVPLQD